MDNTAKMQYFYCYLCEKVKRQQELMVILSRRTTALDHLKFNYYINYTSSEL